MANRRLEAHGRLGWRERFWHCWCKEHSLFRTLVEVSMASVSVRLVFQIPEELGCKRLSSIEATNAV
eukprot:641801-Amphidinium_carterae.1